MNIPLVPSPASTPPRIQLRIDFDSNPARPVTLELELTGTRVTVDVSTGMVEDAWGYLVACGIQAHIETNMPIMFDVVQLPLLTQLFDQISIMALGGLAPLWTLVTSPPESDLPVTVHVSQNDQLLLQWFDGFSDKTEILLEQTVPAFLLLQMPFVASNEAWDLLLSSSNLRPLVGTARMNMEGFCEVTAVVPQMVESAPIQGLFRIDDTHFGLPAVFVPQLLALKGFEFEGRIPKTRIPTPPTSSGSEKHTFSQNETQIVTSLIRDGGHIIVRENPTNRRILALSALDELDAYPMLIVSPPWRVWLWQRHVEEMGRSVTLSHPRADVLITTYHDLVLRKDLLDPVSIIFDEPDVPTAKYPVTRNVLTSLASAYPDTYKLATIGTFPTDSNEILNVCDLVRPGEFSFQGPLPRRYPGDAQLQLAKHAACYYSQDDFEDFDLEMSRLGVAEVEVCQPSQDLSNAFTELRKTAAADPARRLVEALEVVSVGTSQTLSPKLARAMAFLRAEVVAGRKVAALVTHRRTMSMLRAALVPAPVVTAEGPSGHSVTTAALQMEGAVVLLVHHPSTTPDLSQFDSVLVVDYPWNLERIEAMVAHNALPNRPAHLRVLHMANSPDDRVALFAALKREISAAGASSQDSPTDDEALYLIAPRFSEPKRSFSEALGPPQPIKPLA